MRPCAIPLYGFVAPYRGTQSRRFQLPHPRVPKRSEKTVAPERVALMHSKQVLPKRHGAKELHKLVPVLLHCLGGSVVKEVWLYALIAPRLQQEASDCRGNNGLRKNFTYCKGHPMAPIRHNMFPTIRVRGSTFAYSGKTHPSSPACQHSWAGASFRSATCAIQNPSLTHMHFARGRQQTLAVHAMPTLRGQ